MLEHTEYSDADSELDSGRSELAALICIIWIKKNDQAVCRIIVIDAAWVVSLRLQHHSVPAVVLVR